MKHWVKQCNYCSRERYRNRERDQISASVGRNNNLWQKRVDWHMYLCGRVYTYPACGSANISCINMSVWNIPILYLCLSVRCSSIVFSFT